MFKNMSVCFYNRVSIVLGQNRPLSKNTASTVDLLAVKEPNASL